MRHLDLESTKEEKELMKERDQFKSLMVDLYKAQVAKDEKKIKAINISMNKLSVHNDQIIGDIEFFKTLLDLIPLQDGVDSRRFHNIFTLTEKLKDGGLLILSEDDYKWLIEKCEKIDLSTKYKDASGNSQPIFNPLLKRALCKMQAKIFEAVSKI